MKVLIATAEVSPIAKTGGLGDVCGSLPKSLVELGHDVTIFMPFYRQARDWFERTGEPIEPALPTTQITWANWSAEATYLRATLPGTDIPLYLVANEHFFNREQIYASRADGYDDGIERFTIGSPARASSVSGRFDRASRHDPSSSWCLHRHVRAYRLRAVRAGDVRLRGRARYLLPGATAGIDDD